MPGLVTRYLIASLCLLSFSAFSWAEIGIAQLKGDTLNENYTPEASVSGRVIAGISTLHPDKKGSIALLSPVDHQPRDVCVRVISLDGLYWSENTFEWPSDSQPRLVQLKYDSTYPEELSAYTEEELAILSYEGDCDETEEGAALVATRQVENSTPDMLTIFVNSGRSDTYAIITNLTEGVKTQRCERIKEGRRTGFDTTCYINLADIQTDINNLEIRIKRRRYDRMLPSTDLTVRLPSR